jgi:hypothetical protein
MGRGKVLAQRIIPELESQTEPAQPRQFYEELDPPLSKAQVGFMTPRDF